MYSSTFILFSALTAMSQASVVVRAQSTAAVLPPKQSGPAGHYGDVCLPLASPMKPDYSAPCWAWSLLEDECVLGSNTTWSIVNGQQTPSPDGDNFPQLSLRDQQICHCESQYFQVLVGCASCAVKHGVAGEFTPYQADGISSFSSSYCVATRTPTASVGSLLSSAFPDIYTSYYPAFTAKTYTDPLGDNAAISLYFTPSVTGVSAYSITYPNVVTSTGSAGAITTQPINIVSGQIVALGVSGTASSNSAGVTPATGSTTASGASAASVTASTSTKSGSAVETSMAGKIAVAGVFGLAAVVAAL